MHVIDREREPEILAEPAVLPLTQLVMEAAGRGFHGAALLRDVSTAVAIQVEFFTEQVERVLAVVRKDPRMDRDGLLSPQPTKEMIYLSRMFLDVLEGYADLRAPRSDRLMVCRAAEKFLVVGSHWVSRYAAMLDQTHHGCSGQTVEVDWRALTIQIRRRIRQCRNLARDVTLREA